MPRFIGFNSSKAFRRPTLVPVNGPNGTGDLDSSISTSTGFSQVDDQLVVQDLLNSFNISQGDLPGIPSYGTTLWSFIFEPNTADVRAKIVAEVQRLINLDSRITMGHVSATPGENEILIQIEIAIAPTNNVYQVTVSLDRFSGLANLV